MSTSYVMPEPKAISALLEMIFGDGVKVDKAAPDVAGKTVATFIDDSDRLVALCACDDRFVGYSGAALSMIPPDAANEILAGGEMTPVMKENFYEVMNICSKLLMSDSSAHLRLHRTLPAEQAGAAIAELEAATGIGFQVDIPRYGAGCMHFLVT